MNKKKKVFCFFAVLCVISLTLQSCVTKKKEVLYINHNDEVILESNDLSILPTAPEREGYDFIGWEDVNDSDYKKIIKKAKYEVKRNVIIWVNYNGDIIYIVGNVSWEDDLDYSGENPKREADLKYDYVFSGWEIEKYEEYNTIIKTANYSKELKKYTVVYKGQNGNIVNILEKTYEEEFYYPNPTEINGFEFSKWKVSFDEENQEFILESEYNIKKYNSIWINYNGDKLQEDLDVEFDKEVKYNGTLPTKESDEKYNYFFDHWRIETFNDDSLKINYAVYKASLIEYYSEFYDYNNKLLARKIFYYGEEVENIDSPTRLGYKFVEWAVIDKGNRIIEMRAVYEIEFLELPIITITLDDKELKDVNREEYVNSKISILNTEEENKLSEVAAEFKGRGNGSWAYEKKGYRLKFDKKQALFGESKSKHWVLVANGHDNSLMRNNAAYTIVNEVLSGIEYTTSVNIVELYVNNEYHGVYSLFEHIRVDKDRVNIDEEFGVLDTGYLVEYDAYATGIEGIDYFTIKGLKYPFTVKSPDPDDYQDEEITESQYREQVLFIKNYIQNVIDILFKGDYDSLKGLVNIDSVIDAYVIHELFKNTDTGYSSFYMYKKKGGKLFFGPMWDFDLSSGISRGDATSEGLYVSDMVMLESDFTASEIYIELMTKSDFVNDVKMRFNEVLEGIRNEINLLFNNINRYSKSYQRDSIKWHSNMSWKSEQENLKNWLLKRIEWLKVWSNS